MNSPLLKCLLPVTALAIVAFSIRGKVQAQQAGIQQTGIVQLVGASSSHSSSTAKNAVTRSSRLNSGASTWSAGQGSFGTTGAMPAATRGAEGTGGAAAGNLGESSWVAGRGSFGSTAQLGGIWRDSAGASGAPISNSSGKPANGVAFPFTMPGFTIAHPALATKPLSRARAHAAFPRTSNRPYAGDGLLPGSSSRFSVGSPHREAGRMRTDLGRRDFRNRFGRSDRGKSGIGSGKKSSEYRSTTQTSFGFTPFGTRSDREGAASTPPR